MMPDCKTCKEHRQNVEPVPYIVHESAMARQERTIKRLWILIIILVLVIAGLLGYIIWEKEMYDVTVTETYTSESDDGGVAIVNRDGEVNYGEGFLHKDADANP